MPLRLRWRKTPLMNKERIATLVLLMLFALFFTGITIVWVSHPKKPRAQIRAIQTIELARDDSLQKIDEQADVILAKLKADVAETNGASRSDSEAPAHREQVEDFVEGRQAQARATP